MIDYRIPKLAHILAAFMLASAILACNFPFSGRPTPSGSGSPLPTVNYSASDLDSFNDKWRGLLLTTPGGPFSATFTDAELSAALNNGLDQSRADGTDIPVENMLVAITPDAIRVYGTVKLGPVEANGNVALVPSITPAGQVALTVTAVEFGIIDFDPALLDTLVDSLTRSINEPLQNSPTPVHLDSIELGQGTLTISGTLQS